jgi:hypothetical protein
MGAGFEQKVIPAGLQRRMLFVICSPQWHEHFNVLGAFGVAVSITIDIYFHTSPTQLGLVACMWCAAPAILDR